MNFATCSRFPMAVGQLARIRARLPVILLGLLGTGIVGRTAPATQALVLGPVPTEVSVGEGFPLTVTARDADGQVVTNDASPIRLQAFTALPEWPVISEVDPIGQSVEVTNPGTTALDLAGWELVVGREEFDSSFKTHARLPLAAGTILGPGATFTWTGGGTPPGTFPALITDQPFNLPGYRFEAVRLLDPAGEARDEAHLLPYQYPSTLTLWRGTGLRFITSSNVVHSRVGDANRFRSGDWVTNLPPSPGALNAKLALPWQNRGEWSVPAPDVVTLTHGVWSGDVSLPAAAGSLVLVADNGSGLMARSAPLKVRPRPQLSLIVPETLQEASEATAGILGEVTLTLPAPTPTNLSVNLRWSATNEFECLTNLVLPAGASALSFTVTNLDDPWADGLAPVTLTAQAPGYGSATATFWNADDETGTLWLALPEVLREGAGLAPEPGRVWLESPARHDVLVQLASAPPLGVPPAILIAAGRSSGTFPIRVDEDAWLNPSPWRASVTAHIAPWPKAEAFQTLQDNEDSWLTVEAPGEVVEGTPGRCVLKLRAARTVPFNVRVSNPDPEYRARLGLPLEVTVSAGLLEQEFFLKASENATPEGEPSIELHLDWDGRSTNTEKYVRVLDDDAEYHGIEFGYGVPRAVLAGQPFRLRARLVTAFATTFRADLPGEFELLAPPAVAQPAPGNGTIQFTNGVWEGDVTLVGEALAVQMRLKADGREVTSARFDLLQGREHRLAFTDVQWWAAGRTLLVVEPAAAGQPARLTELDPLSGTRGRGLELPRPANLLALADDGSVAWLASPSNALLRVDLPGWRVDREFVLAPGAPQTEAQALLVLPHQPERVVAVVATNRLAGPLFLRMYDAGRPLPALATAPSGGRQRTSLVASPAEPWLFCLWWNGLSRFAITDEGLVLDRSVLQMNTHSLSLQDSLLFTGSGETRSAGAMEVLAPFRPVQSLLGCLAAGRNAAAFLEWNGVLGFFDLASRERLTAHAIPELPVVGGSAPSPDRLLTWGESGLALVYRAAGVIHAFASPALGSGQPDLEVAVTAPARVELPANPGLGSEFTAGITVTNHGPVAAPGVELRWADGGHAALGTLAPGDTFHADIPRGSGTPGLVLTPVSVSCALADVVPGNNAVEAVTAFERADIAGSRQLMLGLNHLIASPDGARLYASLSRDTGAATNGIAVVNPELPAVERVLGTPLPSRRLAISDDGTRLYAQLGTSTLARWDLVSGAPELSIDFAGDTITDFAALPGLPRSVVVAAGGGVLVFDDDQPRAAKFQGDALDRRVGFAAGLLWVAEAGQLRPFTLSAAGLEPRSPIAFNPPWGTLDFSTDGRRLFFVGATFDTLTLDSQIAQELINPCLAETATSSLYTSSGAMLRRLDLDSLALEAEQPVPQAAAGFVQDLVRWGEAGLAARSGPQLLLLRSPLVPAGAAANLVVTLTAPVSPRPFVPLEWTVAVTNRLPAASPRTLLVVSWERMPLDLEVAGWAFDQHVNDLYFDLGEFQGGQAAAIRLRGVIEPFRDYVVSARLITAATDPALEDNQASIRVFVEPPSADLGVVSLSAPLNVVTGEEFVVSSVFTNAGPAALPVVALGFSGASDGEYALVGCDACTTNRDGGLVVGGLPAGGSLEVTVRFKALKSGLHTLALYGQAERQDFNPHNDFIGTVIFAAPAGGGEHIPDVLLPRFGRYAWDPLGRVILATFEGQLSGLVALDPRTLAPRQPVVLGGYVSSFVSCQDGAHAWVFGSTGFTRVNYQTGATDLHFWPDPPGGIWAMASPPTQPDLLVIITGDGMARVYDRGVARSLAYGPMNFLPRLFFTTDGRLWASSGQQLRELRIEPNGLVEVRHLDAVAGWSGVDYTEATGRLFARDGRVIEVASGQLVTDQGPTFADPETGLAFLPLTGGAPLVLQSFDAPGLEPVWRLESPASQVVLTLGTNGFFAQLGDHYRTVPLESLGPARTDFELSALASDVADGIGYELPLQLALTNRSPWAARSTRLEVLLSPGLELAPGQPAAGASNAVLDLGTVIDGTNLTLRLRPTATGSQEIRVSVTSLLPDASPANDVQQRSVIVPGIPRVFFDDSAVAEDGSGSGGTVEAWLSRPAPVEFTVPFEITPGTAQTDDLPALTGTLVFAIGRQWAAAHAIRADATPEGDETAAVSLLPVPTALLMRTNALLTVLNDDWPEVKASDTLIKEGSAGATNITFRFTLGAPAPFPVELWFRTLPGTATPGSDYLPREGWLVFAPGQDSRTALIPVVCDREFEPAETVLVSLVEVRGGVPGVTGAFLSIQNDDPPPQPALEWITANGQLSVEFPTVFGATYQLQTRTNLTKGAWRPVGGPVPGTSQPGRIIVGVPTQEQGYYRLQAQ